MANRIHRGHWIVYLNGIQVPCRSVAVTYGIWGIPEATLSFAPHRLLQRLGAEDRIEVLVCYLDTLIEPARPQYRVLFEGEILGWSYANSAFGRQIDFNAVADISIFNQLFFFFMNTVDAATAFQTTPQGASAPPGSNVFYPASLFYKGLIRTTDAKGNPNPDITRPYELIYNAVKGLTASTIPSESRALPSVNFFTRWIRKRNFQNRFIAMPLLEDPNDTSVGVFPIYKAAKMSSALDAMREGLAPTIGEAGAIFPLLKDILEKAYSELAMIPTPPAMRVRLADGVITEAFDSSKPADPTAPVRLVNYFAKPQMFFAVPPSCNVIFPCMVRSNQYSENYWQQPTRVYINDGFIPSLLDQNYFTAAALRVGYPPEVNVMMQRALLNKGAALLGENAAAVSARAFHNAKNLLIFPEEFFKGPVLSRIPLPAWLSLLLRLSKSRQAKPAPTAATPLPAVTTSDLNNYDQLFALYAEYEFFKQRYEKRGGAVDLVWDPYVVPGFPCVMFDTRKQGLDTVGYLTEVTQTLSTGSMRTSIKYTQGRTLWEMLDLIDRAAKDHGILVGNAPLEPILPVQAATQDFKQAEDLYKSLFFGPDVALSGKKASFDFRDVVGYRSGAAVAPFTLTAAGGGTPATSNISNALNKELAPLVGFDPLFSDYNSAMRYKSRPICTLEDYIHFMFPERTLDQLAGDGVLQYPVGDDSTGIYWGRIKRLRQGPGTPPPATATGTSTAAGVVTIDTDDSTALPADSAQTRADWDSILLAYRNEMSRQVAEE